MGIDQVLVIPTMVIMHLPFARDPEGVGRVLPGLQRLPGGLVRRGARPAVRRGPAAGAGPGPGRQGDLPGRRSSAIRSA